MTVRRSASDIRGGPIRVAVAVALLIASPLCRSEDDARTEEVPSSVDSAIDAAEADGDRPRRRLVNWNEYEGPYITMRLGGGFLVDAATYSQDADSKEQLDLKSDTDLRDFRLILSGRFPRVPWMSYTLGYMYDGDLESWLFRQTGLMFDVPKLWGRFFLGRTKEGTSLNKIMVGYQGWTIERATANDAFVPILADGVKWMGNSPSGRFLGSLGYFNDALSDKEKFNRFDSQIVGRLAWLPLMPDLENTTLLHLGVSARYAEADDGFFHFRSKPEVFPAQQNAIDTGRFPGSHSHLVGLETYYRPGPLVLGAEYFFHQVYSQEADDPYFHGGEVFAAYLLTGETRPYNAKGGYFERVSPSRPVFEGGPGAWELVLRYSYTDLDGGTIRGGKFWRITPMVNWHLSDNVRLELAYGYGVLDRFGLEGGTQFFQSRLQLQL